MWEEEEGRVAKGVRETEGGEQSNGRREREGKTDERKTKNSDSTEGKELDPCDLPRDSIRC